MEALTCPHVEALLRRENPMARPDELHFYAEAYLEYHKAQANIAEHGQIILHPRTGEPLPNPYLAIRASAMKLMRELAHKSPTFRRVDALWPLED